MTKYTLNENLANAAIHLCVMAQDMDISLAELLEAISYAYEEVKNIEDKEEFIRYLKIKALRKVFGYEHNQD